MDRRERLEARRELAATEAALREFEARHADRTGPNAARLIVPKEDRPEYERLTAAVALALLRKRRAESAPLFSSDARTPGTAD